MAIAWNRNIVKYLIKVSENHLINIMSIDGNLTLILDKLNYTIKDDIGNASNTTSNNDADDPNFGQHNITAIVVLTLIYGLLSLTACIGNLLVIWIIGKYMCVYFYYLSFSRQKHPSFCSKSNFRTLKILLPYSFKGKQLQTPREIYCLLKKCEIVWEIEKNA